VALLDRLSKAPHELVLISDLTSELARLADWRYRDADTVRCEPLWRAIEPVSRIEAVRPLASRALWREGDAVCAGTEVSLVSLLTYHLFVEDTFFTMLGKRKKVENVSPNTTVYEVEPTSNYEYWFAYLNALLDISEISGDRGSGSSSGMKPSFLDSTHTTSVVNPRSKGTKVTEQNKTLIMISRVLKDHGSGWMARIGNYNIAFSNENDMYAFFKALSG
jgi:hypothetical protein